ncbi:MAG: hypothetical protein WCX82_04610 [archaeon]|jgi:hypothetical protein
MPKPPKLNIDSLFKSKVINTRVTIKKGIPENLKLNRKIFYTSKARKRILEFKGLQRTFYNETRKPGFTFYEDSKGRFRIRKINTKMENIREFYILELNTSTGVEKYFIKEQRLAKDNPLLKEDPNYLLKMSHNAFNQARALEILKKLGITVIDQEYAFVNKDRSFLVSEFKDHLFTIDEAKDKGIISLELKQLMEDKLVDLNTEINNYFKKYSKNPRVLSDIGTHNTFIDNKAGELFIFDIMISNIDKKQ